MAEVADYDIVLDGPITLSAAAGQDGDVDLALELDSNVNVGIRSVLSYMLDPGSSGITFKLTILPGNASGGTVLGTWTLPAQNGHARQEVIDANVLKTTGNSLRIEVSNGSGTFADIVLLHHVSV